MLKEIIIENFFSFQGRQSIKLNEGLNLLLGINGSGKTTLLNALSLLYEGIAGAGFEKLFQQKWGGFPSVANANGEDMPSRIRLEYIFDEQQLKKINPKVKFGSAPRYVITIRPLGVTSYTLDEKLYAKNTKAEGLTDFVHLEAKNGRGFMSVHHQGGVKSEKTNFGTEMSPQELILRQINDPRRYLPQQTIKAAVASMTIYETFNTSRDSKLRRPVEYNSTMRLQADGTNLVQLLSNLKNRSTRDYERIEESLHTVNAHFRSFDFNVFGTQLYLSLKEKNLGHTIPMQHISDGTLRFLLLMSILQNKERGTIVGLDEPESRLHPDMINTVGKMLKEAARTTQLIIATHSPLLLNSFCLEDILVFEKNADNSTIVKRYTEDDFPQYEGQLLPGQLWLRGEIGGKRW